MARLTPTLLLLALFLTPSLAFGQAWQNLLADRSFDQWQKTNGDAVEGGWIIEEDGTLHLTGKGGNLITRNTFADFELWFEFRTVQKGNNGIKYRVMQYDRSWLGLEYQILDDEAFPKLTREHLTASLYDLVTPKPEVTRLKPRNEFNTGKIRVSNGRVQHWVNGQLMIDEKLTGPTWEAHVKDSKFRNREHFGENPEGHIMLTDHGSETWFRNMFIRDLSGCRCR